MKRSKRMTILPATLQMGLDRRLLSSGVLYYIVRETLAILRENREVHVLRDDEIWLGNQFVLDVLTDADTRQGILEITGQDLDDLAFGDELEYMAEENRLLEMGVRRN